METYTKWIMGHRRNLATVTIPAIIFRYVYRGGRGERGSETGELRLWPTIQGIVQAKLTSLRVYCWLL